MSWKALAKGENQRRGNQCVADADIRAHDHDPSDVLHRIDGDVGWCRQHGVERTIQQAFTPVIKAVAHTLSQWVVREGYQREYPLLGSRLPRRPR
jgi:hypothetical protein